MKEQARLMILTRFWGFVYAKQAQLPSGSQLLRVLGHRCSGSPWEWEKGGALGSVGRFWVFHVLRKPVAASLIAACKAAWTHDEQR